MAEISDINPPTTSNTLRVRVKIGVVEIEFEGAAEFVQHNLDNLLGSVNRSGIVPPHSSSLERQEAYDFEKDTTVAFMEGTPDLSSRTREILEAEFGMPSQREEKVGK